MVNGDRRVIETRAKDGVACFSAFFRKVFRKHRGKSNRNHADIPSSLI